MLAAVLGANHSISSILERKKLIVIAKNTSLNVMFATSVPDPNVFWPPGSASGSVNQKHRILPFSHKNVERTEIMLQNELFIQKCSC
jgi:hypothetical protein